MRPYREAIVLAGGFGTRLAHVVPDVCKPMAPVAGRSFLRFIMNQLAASGFDRVVVADGYRREQIEDFFGSAYRGMAAECAGGFIDIGVPEDYELAQTMLAPLAKSWKLAMFDRDGAINVGTGHLHEPEKLELIPSTVDIMRGYSEDPDYKVVVVTNQAGIAKGLYTEADMRNPHRYMEVELEKLGVHVDAWCFCPRHPDYTGPCKCRKPAPGMLLAAMRDFDAKPGDCVMCGDMSSDKAAADAAGVEFRWAARKAVL